MATQYANGKIVTDGLVLNLNAADPNSYPGTGTTWTDISGLGNNGTLTNGPTFSSTNGGVIVFDGADDRVVCSNAMNSLVGTNTVTFSAWIYRTSAPAYWAGVIANKVNLTNGIALLINPQSYIFWQYSSTSGVYAIYGGQTLSTNIWYNIVGVYDNVGLKTYLNGNLNDSANDSGKSIASSGNMDIMVGDQQPTGSPFPGRIGNVLIYNKALSATQILQNYNAQKARFGLK